MYLQRQNSDSLAMLAPFRWARSGLAIVFMILLIPASIVLGALAMALGDTYEIVRSAWLNGRKF